MTADTQAQGDLPELPAPTTWTLGHYRPIEAFTADQMREYGRLCVAAALQGRGTQEGEPSDAVTRAGSELSNIAFNLSFRNPGQFTARDIVALDEARKKWDAAINAGRAALAQAQKERT